MIRLTRLNGHPIVINAGLIETVEATPDTVLSLTTGKKFVVLEDPEEVIERTIAYQRRAGFDAAVTARAADLTAVRPLAAHHED